MNKLNLDNVPQKPGCYFWLDKNEKIIYIGKAKNLKKRMQSYFSKDVSPKTKILLNSIHSFSFIVCANEKEALVLESSLINKYSPKYNIRLKDFPTYPYVVLSYDGTTRIFISYSKLSKKSSNNTKYTYFGPFPNGTSIRKIVDLISKSYPVRKCRSSDKGICLYEETGNCLGPANSEPIKAMYLDVYNEIKSLFKGSVKNIESFLIAAMKEYAKNEQYEDAIQVKSILDGAQKLFVQKDNSLIENDLKSYDVIGFYKKDEYVSIHIDFIRYGEITSFSNMIITSYSHTEDDLQAFMSQFYTVTPSPDYVIASDEIDLGSNINTSIIVPKKGKKKELLKKSSENAMDYFNSEIKIKKLKDDAKDRSIKDLLNFLDLEDLDAIEVFDVANSKGKSNVGGMIYLKDGNFEKKNYRKFILEEKDFTNDYESIGELVYRRYFNVAMKKNEAPSLIIVDGGLGQYNIVKDILKTLNLDIPFVALSKDEKHNTSKIVFKGEYREIPKKSYEFLYSIQEEVHRYVNTFYRNKVTKKMFETSLDNITGVSNNSKAKLIKKYGNVSVIKKLTIKKLNEDIPISQSKIIFDYYNNKD